MNRHIVRAAMSELVNEGVLHRQSGVGDLHAGLGVVHPGRLDCDDLQPVRGLEVAHGNPQRAGITRDEGDVARPASGGQSLGQAFKPCSSS